MRKNVMWKYGSAVVAALTVLLAATSASAKAPSESTPGSVKVLGLDGNYLGLDPASGRILTSGQFEDPDGPQIEDLLSMPGGALYALLGVGDLPDENGQSRVRIAAMDRATLKTLHSYDMPQPQDTFPELLLDPNHHQLLLSAGAGIQTLAIHTDGSIQANGPMVKPQRPIASSWGAYVDPHDNIVSGFRVFDRQGRLLREIRPDSILDASLKKKFATLTRIKGTADHSYGTIPVASAGDRIVFTVGWDDPKYPVSQTGFIVYDLNAGRVISSFFSQFPVDPGDSPDVLLSPDGHHIVIQQYAWLPSYDHPRNARESAMLSAFGTGKLAIYDAGTGALVGTVDVEPGMTPRRLARPRVIGYSRDASRMYYWFDRHLSVIDLDHAKLVSKALLPDRFDPVAVVGSR